MKYWYISAFIGVSSFCAGYWLKPAITTQTTALTEGAREPVKARIRTTSIEERPSSRVMNSSNSPSLGRSSRALEELDPKLAQVIRNDMEEMFFTDMFSRLAYQNPQKAADFLSEQKGSEYYSALSVELVQSWSQAEPQMAYQWLMKQKGLLAPTDFEAAQIWALTEFSKQSPQEVANLLSSLENEMTQEQVALTLAKNWGEKTPQEAFNWLAEINLENMSDELLTRCYQQVMEGYIADSPEEAKNFITELESSSLKSVLIPQAARELSLNNFDTAANWVRSLPNLADKKSGFLGLFNEENQEQTDQLISFLVADSLLIGDDPSFAEESLQLLVKQGRETVQKKLSELPSSAQGIAALEITYSLLDEGEVEQAEVWISTLSSEDAIAGGAKALATHYFQNSPDLALQWLGRIDQPELRKNTVSQMIAEVDVHSLTSMQKAMEHSGFSDVEQEAYYAAINSRLTEELPLLILPE